MELLKEGDFEQFAGVSFTEESYSCCYGYFEKKGDLLYAIYPKDAPETFIGYMGLSYRPNEKWYEAEGYIARAYRRKGYGSQALVAVCNSAFGGELRGRWRRKIRKIHVTVLEENAEAIRLLESCGFVKNQNVALLMQLFEDPADGRVIANRVVQYSLSQ